MKRSQLVGLGGLTLLTQMFVIGHDPKPATSTFHCHNLYSFKTILMFSSPISSWIFQGYRLQRGLLTKIL